MINKIIDAISTTLFNEFNEEESTYTIYTESVLQGLKTPCFFINSLNPSEDLFRNDRYFQTNQFCIQYIPDDEKEKVKCNEIRERLFDCLEYITIQESTEIKSLIRGSKMSGEYSDGVLNFFVNYDMYVTKEKVENEPMDSCDYNSNLKG